MNIKVYADGVLVRHARSIFPGGEIQVAVALPNYSAAEINILALLKNSDDVMELLMVTDAIKHQISGSTPIHLVMPYVPYARQDRVVNSGEALSIKVFCNLINSQEYATVTVHDPHSDVTTALLNNVKIVSQASILGTLLPYKRDFNAEKDFDNLQHFLRNTIIVSPDAGANKKIGDVAKTLGFEQVVRADKKRDLKTNKIIETVVYSDHVGSKDFLIVDDICDGGRTFIELGKVLRPLTNGKIILYVTHGIFSYGLDVFNGVIDEVYCSHSFGKYPENRNLVSLIKE